MSYISSLTLPMSNHSFRCRTTATTTTNPDLPKQQHFGEKNGGFLMGVWGVVEEWFFTGGVEFPALGRGGG